MAKIVFMGTPDFAVPSLRGLMAHHEVIGVVTQPDRPAGRKGHIVPPPVKVVAEEAGIPILQPERLRRPSAIEALSAWREADLFVVAAFGQILPQAVLDMPRKGCLNVHGSLLPRWRGAAPIHAALLAGDTETGITIMVMDAGLDTGAMLRKRSMGIASDATAQSLHDALAEMGADLLIETIPPYLEGGLMPEVQDDELATYAPQIKRDDGKIDWHQPADYIERMVRAYTPWPGTFTHWGDTTLKIHAGDWMAGQAPVGEVVLIDGVVGIGTGEGIFLPLEVQMPAKKRIDIDAFLNGYPHFVGAQLGEAV